jgi:DNA mismatch repair protein MutS2
MKSKYLEMLELPKVLDTLASLAAFSASKELARGLAPTTQLAQARRLQTVTSEARALLEQTPTLTIGGARDVRPSVEATTRGAILEPEVFLDVMNTLLAGRSIRRSLEKQRSEIPTLHEISGQIEPCKTLVDAIETTFDSRGEIDDAASPELARIRRDLRVARDRLTKKLQRVISDPGTVHMLQEPIITQREGRFVVPLRAEFKGRFKAVIHDQSSSGATLFVEPLQVVEQNNAVRELELAERDEMRRILIELSNLVAEHAQEIVDTVVALAQLDLAFAKARFSERLDAVEPELKSFDERRGSHPGSTLRLRGARHPLLAAETVVPIDVELDEETYALVITGPNTGGKTVALKTVGLMIAMAQCGLHIPAAPDSELSIFENVYTDIGDEQSIEQSLSTFSAHISNIIAILEQANHFSLVLLDELGAGTDPQEGAALAKAILGTLMERRVTTIVATHYPEMKTFAHVMPGVRNASVEFDIESLQPTYHLMIGLPGRSNALAIAERLGLSKGIVDRAKSMIEPDELRAENLLDEIHRQRDATREAQERAEDERVEVQLLREELSARLKTIDDERREVLNTSKEEAAEELTTVREELRRLRSRLKHAALPLKELDQIRGELEAIEQVVVKPVASEAPDLETALPTLNPGDKVLLNTLGREGVVSVVTNDDVEVQIGKLRVRTRVDELSLIASAETEESGPANRSDSKRDGKRPAGKAPSVEIDLRGMVVDEALMELEHRLDAAFLAGMPFVRVIHGKGTGRLRQAIRMNLHDNPYVASFEPGGHGEGGDGVTVIKIAAN